MEKKVAERFFKQAQVVKNRHLFKIALDDRIVRSTTQPIVSPCDVIVFLLIRSQVYSVVYSFL